MDFVTSMWIVLLLKQENTTPHRFELATPPRVFLVRNNIKAYVVKDGATSVLLAGKSAMR